MKHRRKCIARPWGLSDYCEGCHTNTTKCPDRYKYRELRHTKKGRAYRNMSDGEDYANEQVERNNL